MKTTTAHNANAEPAVRPEGDEHPLMFAARAVVRFFFQPSDPTTLGLMRITAGILVLYVHLVYSIGLTDYFGPYAWIGNDVTKFVRQDNEIQGPASNWKEGWLESNGESFKGQTMWSIYFHVEDPKWLWVIHSSILLIMLLFTLGLWTRVTSVLTWVGSVMYLHRMMQPGMLFGMDTMTNVGLFYLMIGSLFGLILDEGGKLAPCGAALSLDRWLQVRRERRRLGAKYVLLPPEPMVSATFATRLIQMNFCLIYFAAGTSKLMGNMWWNGTAPNGFLLNYSFAPFDVPAYVWFLKQLVSHRWAWELFGAIGVIGTLFLELGLPFLIWNRYMRWFMVSGSVLFHTMIALLMGLVTFSLMMLVLALAFVPPEAVQQALLECGKFIRQLWTRRAGGEAGPQMAYSR
ncbi:MAG TPA: HTTM domain-containing protein [Gemmataceae bacterium]|nr:HTTM domain-containing protein [Gemmataceae bacterium]